MKILLAIDGSECAENAADAVIAQFTRHETEVRVFHADEWPRDLPLELSFAEGPDAASLVLAAHERRVREMEAIIARTAERLRAAGFQTSTIMRAGDARTTIVDAAREWGANLIVLGSHGRRGVDRLLLGSVSENVVHRAPCSVEVVRG